MKLRTRVLVFSGVVIAALVGTRFLLRVDAERPVAPPARLGLAAPGRVEPAAEERVIRPQRPGVITAIAVEENQKIEAGQVLLELDRAALLAQLKAEQASVELARANRARLVHGARTQERREAKARLAEAEANLAYSEREFERHDALKNHEAIAAADIDRARRELEVAKARRTENAERAELLDSSVRVDDLAIADAELALAEAKVAMVNVEIDRTYVRSPITGTVLRRFGRLGEAVGIDPPPPLFVVGDLSSLNVRAEIDELDVARVHAGDRAVVSADGFSGKRFGGTVTRVGLVVGGKDIITERPGERKDRKVLEAMIALDPGAELPVGLRVEIFIE